MVALSTSKSAMAGPVGANSSSNIVRDYMLAKINVFSRRLSFHVITVQFVIAARLNFNWRMLQYNLPET